MPAFSRFLRYFMVVGRHGSIRKAADELNVSASAIARQILNVEADIGTPLFERLPTGLRLTAAGEIMMAAGNRWQKNMQDIRAQIEDLRGLKRGHVEMAVIDALARNHLPAAIRAFQDRYPGITVGVRVLANDDVRMAVANGDVDFGILFEPQSYRDLAVRAFVDVVLGFVTPVGHPLAALPDARFTACTGLPMIVPVEPLVMSQQIAVLEGATGMQLDRKVTADDIGMITSLVKEGVGIGILTSLDAIAEIRSGQLAFTRISDTMLRPMTLALCTSSARTPSYAAGIALAEIETGFARLSYPDTVSGPAPGTG